MQQDIEQTLAEKRGRLRRIEAFLDSPVWKEDYRPAIEGAIRERRMAAFAQGVTSLDSAFVVGTLQAQTTGLQHALLLPSVLVEDLRADLRQLIAEQTEGQ